MPKLIFTQPEFAAQSCELPEGTTTVGRSSKNALVIRDSSVSADHCEILVSWNEVIVRERGSRNGTWVNGARVSGQRPVNHGETIRFGRVEARLELPAQPAGDDIDDTIHLLLERAVQAEPARPPGHAVVQPEANPPKVEADDDRTILVPVPPISAASASTRLDRLPGPAAAPTSVRSERRWWVVALVAGAIAIGAWFWWSSR